MAGEAKVKDQAPGDERRECAGLVLLRTRAGQSFDPAAKERSPGFAAGRRKRAQDGRQETAASDSPYIRKEVERAFGRYDLIARPLEEIVRFHEEGLF